MTKTSLYLFVLLHSSIMFCQGALDISEVESFVTQTMEDNHIVGCAITIVNSNDELLTKGYGSIKEDGSGVHVNTPFNIGSMTKSFTGLAILQLLDKGLLSLDDPLITYLPKFKTSNQEWSDQITIRQLLNHNSGLTQLQGNRTQSAEYYESDALAYAVADYQNVTLNHLPGSHYEYSNANYQILGLLIEHLSSQSYEAYIAEHILTPLGMTHSGFTTTEETAEPHRYFAGFTYRYSKTLSKTIVAQGGLYTTANDMSNYLQALLTRDTSILSLASYESILNGEASGIAKFGFAGWRQRTVLQGGKEMDIYWHGGSNPGILATMFIMPDMDLGIAVLSNTNSDYAMYSSWPLCFGTANILLGIPPLASSSLKGILITTSWLIPLFLCYMIWNSTRRLNRNITMMKSIAITIAATITCYILVWLIPNQLGGAYWKTVYEFEPETGMLLIVTATLAMLLALVNWISYFRIRKY